MTRDKKPAYPPMIKLRSLKLNQDVRCLKKGFELKFEWPIVLLVGENGCGKSTLLNLIREHYGAKTAGYFDSHINANVQFEGEKLAPEQVKYFDFHGDDSKYSTVFFADMATQVVAQKMSSGTSSAYQFNQSGIMKSMHSLILLDELARGASPNIQELYANILTQLALRANQIIAVTHSERIMALEKAGCARIYSVEHGNYLSMDDFLRAHVKYGVSQGQKKD
jgi:predicted ATPase